LSGLYQVEVRLLPGAFLAWLRRLPDKCTKALLKHSREAMAESRSVDTSGTRLDDGG
jgi:hypothetical protein